MKDIVVSFRRDLTINLGDYSNAKIGAPFPSAVCEADENPLDVYARLKAMNLEAMRREILEVTTGIATYRREAALRMLGIEPEPKPAPPAKLSVEPNGDEDEDDEDDDPAGVSEAELANAFADDPDDFAEDIDPVAELRESGRLEALGRRDWTDKDGYDPSKQ